MPQREASGKSTVTAGAEARAARRLSRRRREIFWRSSRGDTEGKIGNGSLLSVDAVRGKVAVKSRRMSRILLRRRLRRTRCSKPARLNRYPTF